MTRSVEIPEAAVEAAGKAVQRVMGGSIDLNGGPAYVQFGCAALEAALPYLAPAEPEEREQLWPADAYPEHMAPAPAGDGGLREALEQQVRNMHGQITDLMRQIRERDDAMGEMRGSLADLTSYWLGRAECGDAHPDERSAYEDVARQLNEIRQGDKATARLCACGKPATHANADPDDADWACRAPAVPQPATLPMCVNCESETFQCSACGSLVEPWESAVPQPADREALIKALSPVISLLVRATNPVSLAQRERITELNAGKAADAVLAVLAGEQEQVER